MSSALHFVVLFSCSFLALSNAARTCHGNIQNLHPSGQRNGGVAASHRDVAYDLKDLNNKKSCYDAAADKYCIQAAVIAGIASRESRGGRLLVSTGGYGDGGRGYGILQCDIYASGLPCRNCAWDSCCHIDMMVGQLLVPYINQVKSKHPSWTSSQQLQGGVAAYNFGVSNVVTWTLAPPTTITAMTSSPERSISKAMDGTRIQLYTSTSKQRVELVG